MKITVTDTSTDVLSLIKTAWYDLWEIEENRIKENDSSNNFWVYLYNPTWWSSVFIENIIDATTTDWVEIPAEWDFSLDVNELSKLNLIVATWTQEIKVLIT